MCIAFVTIRKWEWAPAFYWYSSKNTQRHKFGVASISHDCSHSFWTQFVQCLLKRASFKWKEKRISKSTDLILIDISVLLRANPDSNWVKLLNGNSRIICKSNIFKLHSQVYARSTRNANLCLDCFAQIAANADKCQQIAAIYGKCQWINHKSDRNIPTKVP